MKKDDNQYTVNTIPDCNWTKHFQFVFAQNMRFIFHRYSEEHEDWLEKSFLTYKYAWHLQGYSPSNSIHNFIRNRYDDASMAFFFACRFDQLLLVTRFTSLVSSSPLYCPSQQLCESQICVGSRSKLD